MAVLLAGLNQFFTFCSPSFVVRFRGVDILATWATYGSFSWPSAVCSAHPYGK